MAVTSWELFDSRDYDYNLTGEVSFVRRWLATGSEDEGDIHDEMRLNVIPVTFNGAVLQNYTAAPKGNGVWLVEANYESKLREGGLTDSSGAPVDGGRTGGQTLSGMAGEYPAYEFDTTGGTKHITQSIATVNKYAPAGKTAPNMKGAIGVTDDSVEGVDIVIPSCRFSETHYKSLTEVTKTYINNLIDCTGCVNNATFRGRAAGEVLFKGVTGRLKNYDSWELTYQFEVSRNETNLAVGDITVTSKGGWQYLWILYGTSTDQNRIVKQPIAAYVERVYASTNFNNLQIGA